MTGPLLMVVAAGGLHAQDRLQIGIDYRPGVRPGVLVVAGPGLDSTRRIVERDLRFSDRFEMAFWPDSAGPLVGPLNAALYRQFGLAWAVELQLVEGGVEARVVDLASGEVRHRLVRGIDPSGVGPSRLGIHQLSDEIVRQMTGGPGIAATRILFTRDDAIWSVDSDGANLTQVSRGTGRALSAAWAPGGQRIAYTELRDYAGAVVIQTLGSGARQTVPGTTGGGNSITPAFSPDGKELIFARSDEAGTALYRVDVERMCCVQRLTASGRLVIDQNPTYSPDGLRVAFNSTRAGRVQVYVMDADGANQRVLVPFDGEQGSSYAPEWSPDGRKLAFHRDVAGGRQILVHDLASGRTQAVTSVGRNEDPSWAPDSRHIVFKSDRGGGEQLWILDLESHEMRQLTNVNGRARLPAWSPSFARNNP